MLSGFFISLPRIEMTSLKTRGGKVPLMDIVCGWIEHAPGSSAVDLAPHLPNYTEKQLVGALRNLARSGRARRDMLCEREIYYPIKRD